MITYEHFSSFNLYSEGLTFDHSSTNVTIQSFDPLVRFSPTLNRLAAVKAFLDIDEPSCTGAASEADWGGELPVWFAYWRDPFQRKGSNRMIETDRTD